MKDKNMILQSHVVNRKMTMCLNHDGDGMAFDITENLNTCILTWMCTIFC